VLQGDLWHSRLQLDHLAIDSEPAVSVMVDSLRILWRSYGLALACMFVLGAALWALSGWRLDKIAIGAVLLFLPFAPMLTFLSRVLWIYLDQTIDPERF